MREDLQCRHRFHETNEVDSMKRLPKQYSFMFSIFLIILIMSVSIRFSVLDVSASVTGKANETQVYNYLINTMGLNRAAACGVLANIEAESGFNPNSSYTESDGNISHGICQWNGGRYTNLVNYCNNNGYDAGSLNGQLHFLEHELKKSYRSVYNVLTSVSETQQGAYDAAFMWCFYFEVPANRGTRSFSRAVSAATNYWNEYGTGANSGYWQDDSFVWMKLEGATSGSELTAYIKECKPTSCAIKIGTDPSSLQVRGTDLLDGSTVTNRIYYKLSDLGISWQSGTKYYFQFYYVLNGSTVNSKIYSFTFGSTAITQEGNVVVTKGWLDLNGQLDSVNQGALGDYGTCDVYINNSLVADDVSDYYQELNAGTAYLISDIKSKDGYSYDGLVSGALSGTITSGVTTDVRLKFNSCRLDVKGMLDGKASDSLGAYGTFDVYINNQCVADDVNDFNQRITKGAAYEIKDIKASPEYEEGGVTHGYTYEGVSTGTLTGTVGSGSTFVSLRFSSYINVEPGPDWIEMDYLPENISDDWCEIQYKHSYSINAATSPGTGWTQGAANTTYTKSGGETQNFYTVNETDTHRLVRYYYYHFCGTATGAVANYSQVGNFIHYDQVDPGLVSVYWQGSDDDDPNIPAFILTWNSNGNQVFCQSGLTCDGSYDTHDARSKAWYRMNVYQDYIKTVTYEWTKEDSDWMDTLDSSATSVRYRFRLKDAEDPVIVSATVTDITPTGYTVTCEATDDSGIVKIEFASWTDTETEASAVVQEIILDRAEKVYETSIQVPIPGHGNEKDIWYHTKISVYDGVGNVTEYTASEIKAYIPILIRSASRRLVLPADLTEIEGSAFEDALGIGEAILPEGVMTIGSRAFADCPRLVVVYMPDSVAEIASDAFEGSDNIVFLCESDNAAVAYAKEKGLPYLTRGFTA